MGNELAVFTSTALLTQATEAKAKADEVSKDAEIAELKAQMLEFKAMFDAQNTASKTTRKTTKDTSTDATAGVTAE